MTQIEISYSMLPQEDFDVDSLLKDESESLKAALNQLTEQERLTIICRFYRGFTQEQTAKVLNLTQTEISRLERVGIRHLKNYITSEKQMLPHGGNMYGL